MEIESPIPLSSVYSDAVPYIDVTEPYFALQNLTIAPPAAMHGTEGVSCTFTREQPPDSTLLTFGAAELGRHMAILGSVVAARENPVKRKHYYLALDAHLHITNVGTDEPTLRATAHVTAPSYPKKRVTVDVRALTLAGSPYARLVCTYAILSEELMLRIVRTPDPARVFGTPWRPGEPSPYADPVVLRMVKKHDDRHASAVVSLHDVRKMAGHFGPRPTAPIAVLCANAVELCKLLWTSELVAEYSHVVCERLVVAGECIEVHARVLPEGGKFTHRIDFVDEGGESIGFLGQRLREPREVKAKL
ncbi:hypothetical protein H2203_005064 [Taxawa tesnikishii (nom. ined.)]|nr:hypothetical protein H2203_005064 [Dothideales sp. JES 119]